MKKRKPPVVLASMLIVLIGLAVILFPKEQNPGEPPPESEDRAVPTGESRTTPSKDAISKRLKAAESSKPTATVAGEGAAEEGNPKTATIFFPKTTPTAQTPNDSSTSGQWYRPDARAASKEGFKTP